MWFEILRSLKWKKFENGSLPVVCAFTLCVSLFQLCKYTVLGYEVMKPLVVTNMYVCK